jgi:exonuclease III
MFRPDGEPRLERCPCPDPACRHVNTYLNGSNPRHRPYQLDYFLATPQLRERLTSRWADPDPRWFMHSDHRAIFATFDL